MRFTCCIALLVVSALPAIAASQPIKRELPMAAYKAECLVPATNRPLFVGQGIPTVYEHGHIAVARDIHWLSVAAKELVGYAITADSGTIVLVPYTNQPVFVGQPKVRAAIQYIPLGKFPLTSDAVTTALRKRALLARPNQKVLVHRCFRNA